MSRGIRHRRVHVSDALRKTHVAFYNQKEDISVFFIGSSIGNHGTTENIPLKDSNPRENHIHAAV